MTNQSEIVDGVIYKWTNLINGKAYIGQTINEKERYKHHIKESKNKNLVGYRYYFHRALRKYGVENFKYEVLYRMQMPKDISKEILNKQEAYYIDLYDTFRNGYNMTGGGDGVKSRVVSDEERKHHSEMIKGMFAGEKNPFYGKPWTDKQKEANYTKVLKYTKDGEFVEEFESMKDAARSVNKTHSGNIVRCCQGKRDNAYGFKWRYKQLT